MDDLNELIIAYYLETNQINKIVVSLNKTQRIINYEKHRNQKKIKKRETSKETIYSSNKRKIEFWNRIKLLKEHLNLLEIVFDEVELETIIQKSLKLARKKLNSRVELTDSWKLKADNTAIQPNELLKQELEYIKRGGLSN